MDDVASIAMARAQADYGRNPIAKDVLKGFSPEELNAQVITPMLSKAIRQSNQAGDIKRSEYDDFSTAYAAEYARLVAAYNPEP